MNIELRFKEKLVDYMIYSGTLGEKGAKAFKTIKILQYRNVTQSGAVTEWQDVPCVGVDDD